MKSLLAGAATRDMTPAPGAALWGYTDRKGPATGTLDPLYARAVVLRAEDETAAVVALDLGRPPVPKVCEAIRRRVAQAGVDWVMFIATHTHHAPVMEDASQPWVEPMAADIAQATEDAAAKLKPAKLAVARTRIDIGHNRRSIRDGKCFMRWRNEERLPTEPVDTEAIIIRIDDVHCNALATLVHYACHPVIMGPSNREYSGDYVGELCRLVEEHTDAPCVFLQGACGDINPYLDKTSIGDGAVKAMRSEGRACAEALISAWRQAEPQAPASPHIAWKDTAVQVGCRWNLTDPEQRKVFAAFYGDTWADYYLPFATPDFAPVISTLLINRHIAITGIPGEPFIRHQIHFKKSAPAEVPLLCGYANDYFAYFPTVRDALAGGYGGTVGSFAGLGAAERMVLQGKLDIAALLGATGQPARAEDFELPEID